jgi:hypothetical protein
LLVLLLGEVEAVEQDQLVAIIKKRAAEAAVAVWNIMTVPYQGLLAI